MMKWSPIFLYVKEGQAKGTVYTESSKVRGSEME